MNNEPLYKYVQRQVIKWFSIPCFGLLGIFSGKRYARYIKLCKRDAYPKWWFCFWTMIFFNGPAGLMMFYARRAQIAELR